MKMESTENDFEVYLEALESLEKLIVPSFGPCGSQVLTTTSSGSCIVSKDGKTIIDACTPPHPLCNWVKCRVMAHHNTSGDSCKSFILLLSELLRRIKACKRLNDNASFKEFSREISQGFADLATDVLPSLLQSMVLSNSAAVKTSSSDSDAFWEFAKTLIFSTLQGNLSKDTAEVLGNIILEFFKSLYVDPEADMQSKISLICKDFSFLCQEVCGYPASQSHIIEGVLIPRDFAHHDSKLAQNDHTDVCIILVACDFSPESNCLNTSITLSSSEQVFLAITANESKWSRFISRLKEHKVRVIMSADVVPGPLLDLCRQANISVIQSVCLEEITHISHRTGGSLMYDLEEGLDALIHKAQFCKRIILGKQTFTQIGFVDRGGQTLQHIVICAPTSAICRVYSSAVQNSLKNLRLSLDGSLGLIYDNLQMPSHGAFEQLIYAVYGGGALETAMGFALQNASKGISNLRYASLCFAEALGVIPRTLHDNSYRVDRKTYLEGKANYQILDGKVWRGIDAYSGCWVPVAEIGIVEPIAGKVFLWQSVLETMCDLLRIDSIVGVRRVNQEKVDHEQE